MTLTLNVADRTIRGKGNKNLRGSGVMPAVVYGPKTEAHSISMKISEFEKIFKKAGESTMISLAGLGKDMDVIIHDVDFDPLSGIPRHADFYAVDKNVKIRVEVQLEFVGEAPIVKEGAVVTKVLHEIEVEALPKDLPPHLTVDISTLVALDSKIHLRDIVLPAGVVIHADMEEIVAVVSEIKEEVEEAPTAIDMDSIEVEQKGKVEGEEDAVAAEGDK